MSDVTLILEQIEGAIAYMDTVATPADDRQHRAMRLKLAAVYREFHDRMHAAGVFHHHAPALDHGHGTDR